MSANQGRIQYTGIEWAKHSSLRVLNQLGCLSSVFYVLQFNISRVTQKAQAMAPWPGHRLCLASSVCSLVALFDGVQSRPFMIFILS